MHQPNDAASPADGRAEEPWQARICELEIRSALAEDMLEQLNQVVVRLQRQTDALQRQLADLREQTPADGAPFRSLRDELPPHY